ncbi:kinase-like domain-containing protein [Cristinia sonorae]|uniref:Kinase-like domain-containing protein n=1 Tax=Cristinia sonorae TaxID=1940300 RepID=A0A8K0XMS2_9AGAR|nr:kinase-like domain-containing protein [Cristinia sonorae]
MLEVLDSRHYFPQFLWKFFLSNIGPRWQKGYRVHIYDIFTDTLHETRRIPQTKSVFTAFHAPNLADECLAAIKQAEDSFARLEASAEHILATLLRKLSALPPDSEPGTSETNRHRRTVTMEARDEHALLKYLVFLRFRNSEQYHETVLNLGQKASQNHLWIRLIPRGPLRRRAVLRSICAFLDHELGDDVHAVQFFADIEEHCWRVIREGRAEISVGIASEAQEFLSTERCYGNLDEVDPDGSCDGSYHLFFPITPSVAVYLVTTAPDIPQRSANLHTSSPRIPSMSTRLVTIECDTESVPDVHIRNTILLLTSPRYILFSSLPSLVTAITVTPSTSLSSPLSPSLVRLKTTCREKHIREGLMKTLLVKGDVPVTDLTEEVKLYGDCAVEHGSFADIWKGEWVEKMGGFAGGGTKRIIAMKVLRQFMIDNVKEKVLKRLKDEVMTWHRLRHPHIAPLYGIVQLPHHLAMVSPWCNNGTVVSYLRDKNPDADRISLMMQIASGVAYLHNFKPVVIHGDLKGNNILIDDKGNALITDFGVSNVIEDFSSSSSSGSGASTLAASFFGGATRWMAPELVLALVEDEDGGKTPELTKPSDVYAFASVCLEIMTGQLPYPTRTNAHAVTIDKMRGVKPSSGVQRSGQDSGVQGEIWKMMDRCWDEWFVRPNMSEVRDFFEGLAKRRSGGCV